MYFYYQAILLIPLLRQVCGNINNPCHLKHFGCCSNPKSLSETNGFLDPRSFLEYNVKKRLPVIMRGAAKSIKAYHKWTDDYLGQMGVEHQININSETVKKERRDQQVEMMSLDQFIKIYNHSTHYMVDSVPKALRHDVQLPYCIQCDDLSQNLMDLVMWFSSGGTKSVVHTDSADNINCLIRGSKELYMIDPSKFDSASLIDQPQGAYSGVDVDRADFEKYPSLAGAEFYHVQLKAGDCLYIPYKWIHQVRSTDSNLAINFWFYRGAVRNLDENTCRSQFDESLTAEKLQLWSLEAVMGAPGIQGISTFCREIISRRGGDFSSFSSGVIEMFGMMLANNSEGFLEIPKSLVRPILLQVFFILDSDRTGIVEEGELDRLSEADWENVRAKVENLIGVIEMDASPGEEESGSKDEL